jgi:hypothetical protein
MGCSLGPQISPQTQEAKAMANPRTTRGRTKATKIFIVKSAYRCMGLSGISQARALRELSFSISASWVKLLPTEAEHRTSFVICRLDLCLSRAPRWGSSRSCKQERHSLVSPRFLTHPGSRRLYGMGYSLARPSRKYPALGLGAVSGADQNGPFIPCFNSGVPCGI